MFHVNGMTHGIKVSYESFYCPEKIKNNVPIDQHKKCKGEGIPSNNSLPDKLVEKRDCTENMSKQSKLCGQTQKKMKPKIMCPCVCPQTSNKHKSYNMSQKRIQPRLR